jgi:archaellum component FlaG (FlaF/FlaG flagellin family)
MNQLNPKPVAILVIFACLVGMLTGSAITFAVLNAQKSISSSGLIVAVNVGVYSDAACTSNLTSIDWGNIYPGENVNKTIYVKNTGNAPITLTMTTSSWSPTTANNAISIGWDREGISLASGQMVAATISLSTSANAYIVYGITDFSVNIIITGSG